MQDTGVTSKKNHNDDDQDQIKSENYNSNPSSPKSNGKSENLVTVPEMSF